MNIEQYRALKEEETLEEQPIPEDVEETKPIEEETNIEEEVDVEKPEDVPQYVEIDGENIDINELRNGYLRQSDYTKKTQKLANEKREIEEALVFYNEVKNNPDAIESLRASTNIPRMADPNQMHLAKLEEELYDMKLENEINLMQSKYEDFEVRDVLQFASEKKMDNLEDAYHLLKSRNPTSKSQETNNVDVEQMKADLKKEIMAEMNEDSTGSIISSKQSNKIPTTEEVKISSKEKEIASAMGMTNKDYAKWRDASNK